MWLQYSGTWRSLHSMHLSSIWRSLAETDVDRWSTRSDLLSILQLGTHCFQVWYILDLVGITVIAVLFIFLLCSGYIFLILFFLGCLITFQFSHLIHLLRALQRYIVVLWLWTLINNCIWKLWQRQNMTLRARFTNVDQISVQLNQVQRWS